MAGSSTIEAGIKLNGEKEFKSAVSNVGEELRRLKTETDLVKTTFDGQANSAEALSAKQDVLTRTLETYRKKETEVRKGLDHAKESYGNVGQGLQKLYGDLDSATNKLNELKLIYGESSEEVSKQQKEVDKLSTAVQRGERNYESAANRIRRWEMDLNRASAETIRANRAVNENADYLREAETAANGCANSIDEFGRRVRQTAGQTDQTSESIENLGNRAEQISDSLQSSGGSVDIFGQSLLANLASGAISSAIDKLKEFAAEIVKTVAELDAGAHQLQASTGASGASMIRYRDVMQDVWAGNFGESFDDIAEAMSLINRTMGELDSSTLKEMSENTITLRDTFGFDYQESIRAVDMLMSQFGLNGQQAFNLIVQGAQQGLDKNGDLLDSINEYAVHYQQLGYSAGEFFNSLKNGTEAGTFSVDKLGDAMKEYGIRSKDLANTTDEAFQAMGLNAAQMRNDFAKGGTSAREATNKVLNALFSMESEVEQNAAGVNMFGTMWEDLGKDGVKALMNVEGGINSAKDAMNELKKVKYDDIGSSLKTLGRTISEKFLDPIADAVLPKIKSGIDGITAAIDPAKTQMEQFLDDVITTNKELESSTENAKKVMENAQIEASTIQNLGNELLSLNDIEGKSQEQRYKLRAVVQSLSEQLPEIAEAYDQEAGKVKLTNDQIKELINNKRELIIANAAEAVEAEAAANIYKAQMNMQPAKEILKVAGDKVEALKNEKKALQDIQAEYQKTGKMQEDLTPAAIEGKISGIDTEIIKLTGNIESANKEVKKSTDIIDENTKTWDISDAAKKELGITTDKLTDSEKEQTKATQKSTEAETASIESMEAKKEALEMVQSKFEETKASIQQSLEQKINMFDVFNGGDDSTVEEINKNLESQLEGVKNYKANLEIIKDQVGKTIAPEFLQSIENMGLDGANMLKHMVATLNQDNGAELLKEMSDNFVEAFDITEEIAKNGAANETAMEIANGKLGSTKADFSGLRNSIDTAVSDATSSWSKLPDNTRAELDRVIQVAQETGVKIPDGLAESIKSGETSPTEAINQINSAISGTFEGLVSIAQEAGITIPDGIKDGIASGGDAAVKAYQELIQLLQQTGVESETNAQQSGKTSADKYAESMQAQSGTVKNAGTSIAQSGVEGANSKQGEFQQSGAKMMQSMANGISGGAYQVSSQAGAAASSANNSASLYYNAFSSTGGNLAQGLANGFIANAPAISSVAADAVRKAVQAAKDAGGVKSPSRVFRNQVGVHLSKGLELGILDGKKGVMSSATEIARAALEASQAELGIHSPSKVFKEDVGEQIVNGMIFGIKGKKKAAVKESSKLSRDVYNSAAVWLAKYKKSNELSVEDEKYFWKQIANTVKTGTKQYKDALKKSKQDKNFKTDVNDNIVNGYVFGTNKKVAAIKNDTKATRAVYKEATAWLASYKKTHNTSLEDEKYFWNRISGVVQKGSKQYKDALKKSANIDSFQREMQNKVSNLGVSWQKDDKKKTTKSEKEYYNELFKASKTYFDNYKSEHKLSLQEEKYYWEQVRSQMKAGTQGYYDAQKKISAASDAIAKQTKANKKKLEEKNQQKRENRLSNSDSLLSGYKTYNSVSAKAEVDYWNIVRKKFKAGTEERLEADQKYYEAKQNLTDSLKELEDDYYDKTKETNENLKDDIKELNEAYTDSVKERTDSIYNSFDLFDEFESKSESGKKLLYNLKSQVANMAGWEQSLGDLENRGISKELLEELRNKGPEAYASILELNKLSDAELKEYDELNKKKLELAKSQAQKELEPLRQETEKKIKIRQEEAAKELDALLQEYNKGTAALTKGLNKDLKDLAKSSKLAGEDVVAGLLKGMTKKAEKKDTKVAVKKVSSSLASGLEDLPKQGNILGKDMLQGIIDGLTNKKKINKSAKSFIDELKKAIAEAAEIHSPSRLFKKAIGVQISAGVGEGITEGADKAKKPAIDMINSMLVEAQEKMKSQNLQLGELSNSLNYAGRINAFNSLMETAPGVGQKVQGTNAQADNSLNEKFDKMLDMMTTFFPQFAQGQQIVLDNGTLVGEIQPAMSNEFAMSSRRLRGRR